MKEARTEEKTRNKRETNTPLLEENYECSGRREKKTSKHCLEQKVGSNETGNGPCRFKNRVNHEDKLYRSLEGNDALSAHSSLDSDNDLLVASSSEGFLDLVAELAGREGEVVTGVGVEHKGDIAVVGDVDEGVLLTLDNRNLHVVSGGAEILVLLASEDIKTNDVDLRVTVLASLGGGHINDLAGETLENDKAVLAKSAALHREGIGSGLLGRLEIVVFFRHLNND